MDRSLGVVAKIWAGGVVISVLVPLFIYFWDHRLARALGTSLSIFWFYLSSVMLAVFVAWYLFACVKGFVRWRCDVRARKST
jgi:hypothetical protein